MKHYKLIIAAIAAILLTASCGIFGGRASKAQKGNTIGESLLALYTQYKTDGKLDLRNITNIINLANIASVLRGHSFEDDNTEFVNGLINGAQNKISQSNANAVVGLLGKLSSLDLSAVTDASKSVARDAADSAVNAAAATLSNSSEVASAVSTLNSIFSLMK